MQDNRIIDLFSGCGGFSLGAHLSGFNVSLAVDLDPILSSSFGSNFPGVPLRNWNLAEVEPEQLKAAAGGSPAGIIGGPPCQAFSEIGRRSLTDERRDLIGHFFRLVAALKPGFFIMENVRGLGFPGNREVLEDALELVADRHVILGPVLIDAAAFGAPTSRKRLFVFGVDPSKWDVPDLARLDATKNAPLTVRDAIHDLATARFVGTGAEGLDWWQYDGRRRPSPYAEAARGTPPHGLGAASTIGRFSGHTKTQHTDAVVRRFERVPMGRQDPVGKHKRLDWNAQAPTLRAGTGSDRGSYQSVRPIHPSEDRVITPREAARLQGFPDWFVFHPTVWHSFRMIGNSVSPFVSRAVLSWIAGQCFKAEPVREAAE
ncbi:DNA cytosine methyltransferase [Microbaculum marinum]|uniref:DNA (cytosine-5-)-methyltransferase n=1 Tax=Microbaculum marinum TaxID=1764581 RepID=A0AAW9S2V5_9HYPH